MDALAMRGRLLGLRRFPARARRKQDHRHHTDADERGLYWKPDRNRFRQCLGANGFGPEERENIIKWHPPVSGSSPAIAAEYMIKSANERIRLMENCRAYGVKSGSYIPPWKTQEIKPQKPIIRAMPAQH